MDAEPNSIDVTTAERVGVEALLAAHWEAGGTISRLPGENLNLLVRAPDGRRSVLKITTEDSADVELEEAETPTQYQVLIVEMFQRCLTTTSA